MLTRRRALVTNDDGIDAPGLVALAAAAVAAGLEVVVAAPVRQSSGAGAGIVAKTRNGKTPIERRQLADLPGVEAYAVDAQPSYIVRRSAAGWTRHRSWFWRVSTTARTSDAPSCIPARSERR